MHERQKQPEWVPRTPEDHADILLAQGDILGAREILEDFGKEYADPRAFFHANFKAFALPLYELAYHPSTEERVRNANDTYGLIGSLIELELSTRNNFEASSKERYRRIGRLSELTAFGLLLRDGVEANVAAVPVPASREDDIVSGIDFYLSPIGTGKIDDGWPFQVKTSLTHRQRNQYEHSDIGLLVMSDLDRHAKDPDHQNSLAQRMLRELNGSPSDEDLEELSCASSLAYEKITQSRKTRRARNRHKVLSALFRTTHADNRASEAY